jgi:hypothetical protein
MLTKVLHDLKALCNIMLTLCQNTFGLWFLIRLSFLSGAFGGETEHDPPTIHIDNFNTGFNPADLNATISEALNLCQVRNLLADSRHRLLFSSFQPAQDGLYDGNVKEGSEVFRAAIYDYTKGRTILINGIPFDPYNIFTTTVSSQPAPNAEELAEAAQIAGVRSDESVSQGMPGFEEIQLPDGTTHRLLHLILNSGNHSRLVSVNMNNSTFNAQEAAPKQCTAPDNNDLLGTSIYRDSPNIGSGSANVVISQGGKVLWTFKVTRPATSLPVPDGSGVELQYVKYKGKTVLYRAHVPILNVQYEEPSASCRPTYRDWQDEEWTFKCEGSDAVQGFRICTSPPQTIFDPPHVDASGDFNGVAFSVEGQEVVLKSQMRAGWYRYVSEWRFHVDGTLKPRFGFGAVKSGGNCVCQVHRHHVYWRLDFDIGTASNNLVREFNDPPIFNNAKYHEIQFETKRPKRQGRHWEISNSRTRNKYGLFPGANDGTLDEFGVGDLWVLKYHSGELVDRPLISNKAGIDEKFVNGESVRNTDVVIWYAAHFRHDQITQGGVGQIVGPELRPLKW